MTRLLAITMVFASFAFAGCSSTTDDCTPGTQQACSCDNGATGTQMCGVSHIFTECSCASTGTDAGTVDAGSMDSSVPTDASSPSDATTDGTRPRPDGGVVFIPDSGHADAGTPDAGCVTVSQCDDGNVCTTDNCLLGSCTHEAISCADSDTCTLDHCDPTTGCFYTPWCDDGIDCTVDVCNHPGMLTFCENTPTPSLCNDGNSATTDSCFVSGVDGGVNGCVHIGG